MESEQAIDIEPRLNNNSSLGDGVGTVTDKQKQDKNSQDLDEITYNNTTVKKELTSNEPPSKTHDVITSTIKLSDRKQQNTALTVGRFFSVTFVGSLESGYFNSVNDVYVKYSIVAGPDWILTAGSDLGITQISRYKINSDGLQQFVWNQPITISYRSYNYFGWPQIIVSVYHFDAFGNDQILGYGCIHLPITNRFPSNYKHTIIIYSPQSTSYFRQLLSWFTRRKPELIDSNLFARSDCRKVLQTIAVGKLELTINLTTKDTSANGYKS